MKGLANGWDRSKGRPEPIRALNRVKELENHEPLVDLREACPRVIIARPSVIPYLRQTVAEKLHAASLALPTDYRLGVVDAWRPFPRQVLIFERMWDGLLRAMRKSGALCAGLLPPPIKKLRPDTPPARP